MPCIETVYRERECVCVCARNMCVFISIYIHMCMCVYTYVQYYIFFPCKFKFALPSMYANTVYMFMNTHMFK